MTTRAPGSLDQASDRAVFADLFARVNTVVDFLLGLACLAVAASLWVRRRPPGEPLRPVLLLVAGFAALMGAGYFVSLLTEEARALPVVLAWALVAVLVRRLSRAEAEAAAVRESEARFRSLFEQAADAILVFGPDGRVLDANRTACHTLGYDREELLPLTIADLEAATDPAGTAAGGAEAAEASYRRKDGTVFPAEVRVAAIDDRGRRERLAVVRDVTRRRRAENDLREREQFLRNVIARIPCGVYWKDRDSVYLGCNDQVARDLGLDGPWQAVGRTDYELVFKPGEAEFQRMCDQDVMGGGPALTDVEETQTREGGVRATLLTSKVPLRDAGGAVVGVLGVYHDITGRKRVEEQACQSQKMEAVGRLAGGIAHDFNNLLTVISGNAGLIRERTPAGSDQAEMLDDLEYAANQASGLVRQLLLFSRRQPPRPEVVDLNAVVSGMSGLFRRLFGERVAVVTRLSPDPVRVRADRVRLEQVVVNLAVNARDAMPGGGTLTIATGLEYGSGPHPARLSVSDTGTGMTDEVKARIFEPFFTTKGPDKGTGLGLATVFGIVEEAGGRLEVESAVGLGTTFRVCLPACAADGGASTVIESRAATDRVEWGAGRVVLLAEDDDTVRKFARVILENQGYAVREAGDAEEALKLLAPDRPVDFLVTDLTMPGLSGLELAALVRAEQPGVPVVFVSGYSEESARLGTIPGSVFLPKPFTPADLLGAMRRAAAPSTDPNLR